MKFTNLILLFLSVILISSCKKENPDTTPAFTVTKYDAVKVTKTTTLPTYVHYMPWFGSKSYSGSWHHWGDNADVIKGNGERSIPAVYYPLIDLYDSKDQGFLEYAFLCMKLSGVDGVFIDYYSEIQLNDYPFNLERTIAAMDMADKVGLKYAVVYEDALLVQGANAGKGTQVEILTQNMNYLKANIFNRANYVTVGGKPLLMIFGPSSNVTSVQWRNIIKQDIALVGVIWKNQAGFNMSTLDGAMSWTGKSSDASGELDQCKNYPISIAGAMPGFETVTGGNNTDPRNGANFTEGLNNSKAKNPTFLQIPTWNDWQEGTTIEPSVEYGYTRLQIVQNFLGVSYTKAELELTVQLYKKRQQYKGKALENLKLDQVFYYLRALRINEAKDLLATL